MADYSTNKTAKLLKPNRSALQKFLNVKSGNLIEILDQTQVGEIGADVVSEYEDDYNDPRLVKKRDNWREGQKLATQEIQEKNTPFENAANVKYPLLTTAAIQFASRAYPEIVQGNTVVRPKIVGDTTPEIPEGPEQQAQQQEQDSKIARAERVCEFINWQLFNEIEEWEEDTDKLMGMLPLYGCMFRCVFYSHDKKRIATEIYTPEKLVMPYMTPSMSVSPRISKEFELYPKDVVTRIRNGRYSEFNDFDDEEKEEADAYIEQYKWLDLDEDGFKEPYIVTVHKDSGQCLRISPNYRLEDIIINEKGNISKIIPIKYFVKYPFIPSIDGGIYDMGFYDLLYPINEVVNSLTNQLLDAGTLANTNSGFVSASLGLRKKETFQMKIGEYKTVPANGMDIRQQIYRMDWGGPNVTLFSLLSFMIDAGRDIANLKEVLEGTQHGETATTTMALIEQGLKVFSAIYKRIHRALSKELQLIRFWNNEIRNPLYGEVIDTRMTQEDFSNDDLDFVPVSDPAVTTDMQKMAKVQFKMQFLNDPYIDQMKLRKQIWEGANMDDWESVKAGNDPQLQQMQQQMQEMQQQIQQLAQANQGLQQTNQDLAKTTKFDQQLKMVQEDRLATVDEAKTINTEIDSVKKLAEAEVIAQEAGTNIEELKQEVEQTGKEFVFNEQTGAIDAAAG